MYFVRILQFSTLILLTINASMGKEETVTCNLNPSNVDKVPVQVYINGGTKLDDTWIAQYCSWRDAGFPYDKYAPVTVKVGAEITCDGNKCTCPNDENEKADCQATFQHACASVALGEAEYLKFLCCTGLADKNTGLQKGFDKCAAENGDLKNKVAICMAKTSGADSPQEIALKNAKEVTDKGVKLNENREPFLFFDGKFDKCINEHAYVWWLKTICSMLKEALAKTIDTCKEAMKGS